MNAYLDASALFAFFTSDIHTPRVVRWVAVAHDRVLLSEWTLAEFSSALAVAQRMGRFTADHRVGLELAVDTWLAPRRPPLPVIAGDGQAARQLIRGLTRPLRAADALHLVISRRLGCSLVTFDRGLRAVAADLGIPVEDL